MVEVAKKRWCFVYVFCVGWKWFIDERLGIWSNGVGEKKLIMMGAWGDENKKNEGFMGDDLWYTYYYLSFNYVAFESY